MNTGTRIAHVKVSKVVVALTLLVGMLGFHVSGANADDSRSFSETGKTVSGTFLDYWNTHGALAQQGYPISEEMEETSDTDGQTYTVQYFERAVFEKHPENDAPYDVLLSLLGSNLYKSKYNGDAPGQQASKTNARTFSETGKTVGGVFRKYWEQHGGLAQQGYPISNEFKEESATDGKTYTVQYFERAVFELHSENAGKPSEVLLSLLGTFRFEGGSDNGGTPPPPPKTPAGLNIPGWTHITVTTNQIAIFYNAKTGVANTARLGTDGSLTLLQKYPDESKGHDEFGEDWTDMEAGPNNQVLLYASEDGAFALLKVGDDGQFSVTASFRIVGDFSKITIDPISGIMFYQNKDKKTTTVDRLNADGTFTNLKATGPEIDGMSDDLVVPMLGGLWYDYAPDSGQVNVYTISGKGELVGAGLPANVGEGVTQIVSDYSSHAVFYSKTNAVFTTAKVTFNGDPIQLTSATQAAKSWSIVAATQSIFLICYDDEGNIQTNYVVPGSGAIVPLKSYEAGK